VQQGALDALEFLRLPLSIGNDGRPELETLIQLRENFLLASVLTVQLQAEPSKAYLFQPIVHNAECGHLLRNK
jgi:hypothetical protein